MKKTKKCERARRVPPHPVLPLIRSLPEPLLPLSAGSHWLHLAAAESAHAESFLTGIEADPLAEEVGGGVPAPVGTGGAVVPVAWNFAHLPLVLVLWYIPPVRGILSLFLI